MSGANVGNKDKWRKVLDAEVNRWSALPHDQVVSALSDAQTYEVDFETKKYRVQVGVVEIAEQYLHINVSVDDGSVGRPLSRSFFCRTS